MPKYYLNTFFTARARAKSTQLALHKAYADLSKGSVRDDRSDIDVDIHMENNAVHSGQMYPEYVVTNAGYGRKK